MSDNVVDIYTNRTIDIAHRLENYNGKCQYLHGHSIKFEIWIRGYVDDRTGMVVDFVEIKNIIDKLDHHYLNEILDFEPTAENLAIYIANRINDTNPNLLEIKVRCWETSNSFAEYKIKNEKQKNEDIFVFV